MKEFDFFKFLKNNSINGIFIDEGYTFGSPGIRMSINGGIVKIYYTFSDAIRVIVFDKSLQTIENGKDVLDVINNLTALYKLGRFIPEESAITLISKDVFNTQLTLTQNMLIGDIRSRDKQIDALYEVVAILIHEIDNLKSDIEYGYMWSESIFDDLNIPSDIKKKLGIYFGKTEDEN